tara:strand:- start:2772 stop:3689 length:918 start_codon:yes stop_codon:yes gene_type:complete
MGLFGGQNLRQLAATSVSYPPNVHQDGAGTPYLQLQPRPYKTLLERNGAGVAAPLNDTTLPAIRIAVPNSIQSTDTFNYDQVSLLKEGGMAKLANGLMGGGEGSGGAIDLLASAAQGADILGVGQALAANFGRKLNPKEELLFNGPSLRQHSFTFNLFAKNSLDAVAIVSIIKYLKKTSYPTSTGVGDIDFSSFLGDDVGGFIDSAVQGQNDLAFVFPHQWEITMQPSDTDNGFPYIPSVFCTSISTNFSGNGLTTLLKGNSRILEGGSEVETPSDDYFQSVELTLSFQDISVHTAENIFRRGTV